jgi:hypothetical protein
VITLDNPLQDDKGGQVSLEATTQLGVIESTVLRHLDRILKQHWNLGKQILLCWTVTERGVQLLAAPHFFLGNFTASLTDCAPVDRLDALNGRFIRNLIAGPRYMPPSEFRGAASRLELTPLQIDLPIPLVMRPAIVNAIDRMIKRYSLSYVKSRAVLLFDIVNFSLVTPFEQTSQLNSLSYSLNAAHNKLRQKNIEINFSRTTTGDGYYVWHQDDSSRANLELFQFMLLVLADNAIAQQAAKAGRGMGQIVPKIRTGFHIGSHFEFYQVEGLNPGMNSYIVGDVTIELARMLDRAESGQVFIGDFNTQVPTSDRESAYLIAADTERFVERANRQLLQLEGVRLSGKEVTTMHSFLTGVNGASGGRSIRRYQITDKHGGSRSAYNLRVNIRLKGHRTPIILGLQHNDLPRHAASVRSRAPSSPRILSSRLVGAVARSSTGKGSSAKKEARKAIKKERLPAFED